MKKKIGFIGLGTMGKGMVLNLLKNNFEVVAYNRNKEKTKEIKDQHFSTVSTPKELPLKVQIIFICISNDKAVEEVLFQKNGLFETITENNILVDCSTTSIEMTERIAKECTKRGIQFLDAPLTGSKLGAETGTLTFIIGGNKEVVEKNNEVFMAMGKKIISCGKNTNGQRLKIALNLTQALILESYFEGLLFALKQGISLETALELFENSGAKNGIASFKIPYVLKNDFKQHFKLSLMKKDLDLSQKELKKYKVNFPLSNKIIEVYEEAVKDGFGDEDICATIKVLEKKGGIEVKK